MENQQTLEQIAEQHAIEMCDHCKYGRGIECIKDKIKASVLSRFGEFTVNIGTSAEIIGCSCNTNWWNCRLHHQQTPEEMANEINVCFSKPYQNLQRELFEKKKEIESFKEENAKLVEALRKLTDSKLFENIIHLNARAGGKQELADAWQNAIQLLQTYETK